MILTTFESINGIKIYVIEYIVMSKEYYYVISRKSESKIYIAKNNKAFMKYFLENTDEFRDLCMDIFMEMMNYGIKKSAYGRIFFESFDMVHMYDIRDPPVWDYCVEDICDILKRKSFAEFVDALEGKYEGCKKKPGLISIKRYRKSDFTRIY
jgi:hypothetical protein